MQVYFLEHLELQFGGILGIVTKRQSNKFLSFILAFASRFNDVSNMFWFNPRSIRNKYITICINRNNKSKNTTNSLLKTGIIVSIGLAIHNFPEGLAIGSGFEASIKLGLSLALAICLHDVPEGIFQNRY